MVAMCIEEKMSFPVIDWEGIMIETQKRLHNFIRKRVSNFADVDDLVQTTWLEVLVNKNRFRGNSRPETWIFGIAMNLVKNYYKEMRIRSTTDKPEEELENETVPKDQPEDIVCGKEILTQAIGRFSKLPCEYQRLLKVIVENDISYCELADVLKIPIGTVRSRLSRLRQILREELHWDKIR